MKYTLKKLITLIITLLIISILTFAAFSVIPGDAATARLGVNADPEQVEAYREALGLNDPMPVRYVNWLKGVIGGDFGESYQYSGTTVWSLLSERLPVTILLVVLSFILILAISLPLGILSAKYAGKWLDTLIHQMTQITMAIPPFFLGIIITYLFGLILKMFQPGNFIAPGEDFLGSVRYLIFPALAIAIPKIAMVVKFLRNSMLEETKKDYVRTAYSKGCRDNKVLYRHILKNAMIPVITFLALVIAEIIANSIIVEQVFSVPGLGRLLITSISNRDYPVVQAVVTYITAMVVIINFIVDILYRLVDPRIEVS